MTAMMNIRKKLTAMVIAALVMTALLAITGIGGDSNEEISETGRQGRERKSSICLYKCPASLICEMGMKI